MTGGIGRSRAAANASDWIGLGEASRLLGISEGTLRRWADDGLVRTFTTPGGHRRFSRRALHALLPGSARRPTLARLGLSPDRMAGAYRARGPRRRRQSEERPRPAWLGQLDPEARASFAERGRLLLGLLLDHLDAADEETARTRLQEAAQLASEQGRVASRLGASMSDAVQAFLDYRSPFMTQLVATARRRGLDTRQATELLLAAEAAVDRLLMATMTGHSLESGTRRPASGTRQTPP